MKRLMLFMAALVLMAGCGNNVVGPTPVEKAAAVGKTSSPNLIPPVSATNYLAPEPRDDQLPYDG